MLSRFPQNLYIFAEYCGIRYSVLASDKGTNTAYFGWVQAAVEN